LIIPLGIALHEWGGKKWFRSCLAVLIGWSVFAIWSEAIAGQSFPGYEENPLWEVSLPALVSGSVARNWGMLLGLRGLWSVLPLALFVVLFLMVLLSLKDSKETVSSSTAASRSE
jgi:hypothetical protein